jgi:hypothetical protein
VLTLTVTDFTAGGTTLIVADIWLPARAVTPVGTRIAAQTANAVTARRPWLATRADTILLGVPDFAVGCSGRVTLT